METENEKWIKIRADFVKLVDDAVELNKRLRDVLPNEIHDVINTLSFLHRFGTVRIDIGRAVGKTKYCIEHLDKDDVLVVPTEQAKRLVEKFVPSHAVCLSALEIVPKSKALSTPNRVYVDEPSEFSLEGFRSVYRALGRSTSQTFILLGG